MIYELKQTLVPTVNESVQLASPRKVQNLLLQRGLPAVETFTALYLNGKHRCVAQQVISTGTINSALVHPRDVFGPAIRLGTCAAIIVAHNHPSGDVTPSPEDIALTKRLKEAGDILGIAIVDHVIYSHDSFYSMREQTCLLS